MAKPITWRNIAAPNFSSAPIGQAVDAFRSAAGGFGDLTQSLFQTQDRIDQGYTNEALRQALQTGQVNPNLNPRADAAAVWEGILGKRKADTEDKYTQEQTRNIGLEADQRAFEQTPEQRALAARFAAQKLATGEVDIQEGLSNIESNKISMKLNQRRAEIENRNDAEAQTIKTQARDLEGRLIAGKQQQYQSYLQQNPGDEAGARIHADKWSQSPEARQYLESYAVENQFFPESWELTTWGEIDELARATTANLTEKRLERQEKLEEMVGKRMVAELNGSLDYTIFKDGRRTEGSQEELDAQKMSSNADALSKIQNGVPGAGRKINISKLTDLKPSSPEMKTLQIAREKFPNSSLLAGAIEPFIASDGDFDWKGFREAMGDAGPLIAMDRINQLRVQRGLPALPTEGGQQTDGSGGGSVTSADLGLPQTRGVETKSATATLLQNYNTRLKTAEDAIAALPDDAGPGGLVPLGGGVKTLKAALARAKKDGKPTPGELPNLERNLQILENLLRRYQEGAKRQAEYDAVGN